MDLRLLATFLAVVEEEHFGRAAARLFLSPPAVTQHIRRLEAEVGAQLLHRTSPVAPTPAGARLVGHARTLLAAADAALDDMRETVRLEQEGGSRPLRIGIMGHGSAEITPAAINAYRRARPQTRVELHDLDFTEHVSALVEERVDLAFIRPMPDDPRIEGDVMVTEQRIVVVPEAARLADAREEGVRVADLEDLPIFRVPERTPDVFQDYLYFSSPDPRRSMHCALNPQEVLTGVLADRAAGSGLRSFARYYAWPGAVFVPVLDAPWESSHLAHRVGDPDPEVAIFRALAVAVAKDMAPRIAAEAGGPLPGGAGAPG
ncbi:LysR family transcriptional regulator [Nocardiopsis potens]|uniref:LysR family transcriptional regulator n=1 Tax=Nocardiopsis potens TaxID=1246458 RepID=UPI0003475249|nr:LysR family transcriptional regulator [Nocardiopsis potens]